MELTCPKCHEPMRTYERNGVHVDQCTGCRGIFLDRGELERLVDAEDRWNAGTAAPAEQHRPAAAQGPQGQPAQQAQPAASLGGMVGEVLQQVRAQQQGHGQRQQPYPQTYQQPYPRPYKGKKKQSFLGELFG